MKKILFIISFICYILICSLASYSQTKTYLDYNLKASQCIFKELLLVEQANSIFKLWTNNDLTSGDARKELEKIENNINQTSREMSKLSGAEIFQSLHKVYTYTTDTMAKAIKNHSKFIESNDLKSADIRDKLRKHLLSYVENIYDCQLRNLIAQLEFQQSLNLSSETESIREYFVWNNKILSIMSQQAEISKDMEKMMLNLSLGGIDLEEAQRVEKELYDRVISTAKNLNSINPGFSLKPLHEKFQKSFSYYINFHKSLINYLEMPTIEKSREMQEKSGQANKMNFEFNESCFQFLKGQIDSSSGDKKN